ncbi:sigma-70 family RNA polymerase sigma factor [Neiella sp. HB171785]|uniref:Sigma-70 family RNA polymerase sigma factor n=1 Tax=Neiella litorisoli TaxID=2771431 RepID=A0A8J6UMB5_9GAMM|nr:sigma-70 family RNA polymerase sigma factor [Neiella litorisoli]MBD1390450.1 sigma-70 family RNA polymerase sigma factor [Neiella litorisoli]
MTLRNDDQLLTDYGKRGDAAAFDILYQRFRQPLFGFIRQQLPDAIANEVFQECWMVVIEQAADYMPCGSFRGYLFTIARRKIADYWRRQQRQPSQTSDDDGNIEPISDDIDPQIIQLQQATNDVILMCVGRLPKAQRDVFMLKQTGLAVEEISLILGATFETVKSRIRASYSKLRSCWERHHDK